MSALGVKLAYLVNVSRVLVDTAQGITAFCDLVGRGQLTHLLLWCRIESREEKQREERRFHSFAEPTVHLLMAVRGGKDERKRAEKRRERPNFG